MADIWYSLAEIILFMAVAWILISIMGPLLIGVQGSFEATICKFNAWMRTNTVGNPLMQSVLSGSDTITGGFAGNVASSMTIPLVCKKAPPLNYRGDTPVISELVTKIIDESVNCWDQFGLGKWDPLMLSNEGQIFTCYEQVMDINCTTSDIASLWPESTSETLALASTGAIGQAVINYYMTSTEFDYIGFRKTYRDILPSGPIIGTASYASQQITCDGTMRKYQISLYFVDVFSVYKTPQVLPLLCQSLTASELRSDSIYLCIFEYTGGL